MRALIYSVKSVSCDLLKSKPIVLLINAKGQAPSSGWTTPLLMPWVYLVPPGDGMLDLSFTAESPTGGGQSDVLTDIEVKFQPMAVPHWVKGVRVHATTNKIEATAGFSPKAGDEDPFPLRRAFPWAVGKAAE